MAPAIRNFVLLFAGCLVFHVAGTWAMPLIDRDEPRFAEASREMIERGDYVVPFLNNRYRFDKPPLTYWAHTVSYRILGENDFAARFPTAVAASLTALLLFAWGRRIAGERLGWWAAIIFTLCLQVFIHGKAAVADMWLVLFVTAAHWAGYELLRDRLSTTNATVIADAPQRRWWWLFYLALALGFLAKGPIAWTPLLAIALTRFFLPGVKLNRRFLFTTGLLFTLSIVAVWGIPALVRTEGQFFNIGIGKHVVARSVVAMEGHGAKSFWAYLGSLPFYFVLAFISFLPWSIKFPWLAKRLWRNRDPLDNYLVVGAAVIFVLFTLVKTKLPHYTLPAFPLLALLLAKALFELPDAQRFIRRTAIIAGCAALIAVCVLPFARRYNPAIQLVEQARADLKPEMEFGAIDYKEPSVIWYFRKHVKGFLSDLDDDTAPPFMDRAGPRFLILPTSLVPTVFPAIPPDWKTHRATGFNAANGKRVDLTLLLKPQ